MQNENINESLDDDIDEINDILTSYCDQPSASVDVAAFIEKADATLRLKNLQLDFDDVEAAKLDSMDSDGIVSLSFPVYDADKQQTDLDLVLSYVFDEEDGKFLIDLELCYEWEHELDDEVDLEAEDE